MKGLAFLLAAGLLCGAAPLGAQGIDFRGPGGGFSSPVTTDPVSATGVWTFNNAANTPVTLSDGIIDSTLTSGRCAYVGASGRIVDAATCTFDGTGMRIGTATTADGNADSLFAASATTKKALVIQAKATPTQPPFEVQQSTGAVWLKVTTDGALEVDQKTAATSTRMLKVSYQATEQMSVDNGGILYTRVGANFGAGFTVIDGSGNLTALANLSGRHLMSNGTSPTAPAGGGTCGTSTPSIAGKDSGFKLTVGSVAATSCTVTFGTAWATAPVCVANAATTTTALNIATGTTNVTISAAALTPAEVLHVVCVGF